MTHDEMAAVLADPRNLERWHKRVARYTDPDVCWIWGGYENRVGMFQVSVGDRRRPLIASRMALMVKLGRPLRDGMFACHSCDRSGCVNPDCLWEGTNTDNMIDASLKGRLSKHSNGPAERVEGIVRMRRSVARRRWLLERGERELEHLIAEHKSLVRVEAAAAQSVRRMQFGSEPIKYAAVHLAIPASYGRAVEVPA